VFLEDHEIDFPDPLNATTRRRSVHRFADQSVRLSLGAAFASPGSFFQINHHRDHAQIEARGGFARLPRDAFSCPLFNSLRNLGDIEQSGIFSIYLPVITREFQHKGNSYQVEIRPARITYKNRKEKEKEFYPTYREELIEEALRKIACDNLKGIYLDNAAGVQFTLYELKKELETRGHAINIPDLIESLKICNLTSISIQKDDGKTLMQSPIFPTLLLASKDDWLENPKKARCYIQFNPLVTASINQITYRQFDYAKYMEYKHRLSRWLHKRLCHNYIQASLFNTYTIKMTTILRDSGTQVSDIPSRNVRRIDESLNELKDKDILMRYEKEILRGKRNSIADIKYDLSPSLHFYLRNEES